MQYTTGTRTPTITPTNQLLYTVLYHPPGSITCTITTRILTRVVQFEAHTTDNICGRPIAIRTGGIRAPPPVGFETLRICCIAGAPEQSWKIKKYP